MAKKKTYLIDGDDSGWIGSHRDGPGLSAEDMYGTDLAPLYDEVERAICVEGRKEAIAIARRLRDTYSTPSMGQGDPDYRIRYDVLSTPDRSLIYRAQRIERAEPDAEAEGGN